MPGPLTWLEIRSHYAAQYRERKRHGLTQVAVGERGGLRQNQVSRMMKNRTKGPNVETFVRAVRGLGVPLSEFFADLEAHSPAENIAREILRDPKFREEMRALIREALRDVRV